MDKELEGREVAPSGWHRPATQLSACQAKWRGLQQALGEPRKPMAGWLQVVYLQ